MFFFPPLSLIALAPLSLSSPIAFSSASLHHLSHFLSLRAYASAPPAHSTHPIHCSFHPMGKKGLTSIFSRLAVADSPVAAGSPSPPWPWPSCRSPQTDSFRAHYEEPCTTAVGGGRPARLRKGGEMYKTVNSVYFDSAEDDDCFGDGDEEEEVPEDDSFSTTTASDEWSEAVIRSLGWTSTDRFFFDPGPATNSILAATRAPTPPPEEEEAEKAAALSDSDDGSLPLPAPHPDKSQLVEESVAVAVDSEDPYRDFRASMEEMVAAHGLRDWEALEELLLWYLRVNGKHNHALIVGAFVDLLIGLAASTAAKTTSTTSSSRSTASTSTACDVTTTTSATMEQCGGRSNDPSCSSAASSDDLEEEEEEAGDDLTRSIAPSTPAS